MPQITKQANDYTCYLACIENFLRDHGRELDQLATVAEHPDLFNGGQKIEGSCSNEHWEEAAKRIGLNFEWSNGNIDLKPKNGIILGCFWNKEPGQAHVVRLLGISQNAFLVMNPTGEGDIHPIPQDWVQCAATVTLPPQVQQPEA